MKKGSYNKWEFEDYAMPVIGIMAAYILYKMVSKPKTQ